MSEHALDRGSTSPVFRNPIATRLRLLAPRSADCGMIVYVLSVEVVQVGLPSFLAQYVALLFAAYGSDKLTRQASHL